ncbi:MULTISPECIES: nickel-dependent lactate racemase [Anaerotruncus]|uniref:nickel-dependent lactate racemase n=1 Tax=Anaerotruncus TaxID=244127 RepID=UPI000E482F5C|nr:MULTISPECIES: nickel-dependent lactate racemase [Anaerotruncus]RGX55562.1 nickel-dependent lactate racemase [Anaerotruncus sp. AF02-27]
MMQIELPYGKGKLTAQIPDERIQTVIHSRLDSFQPGKDEYEIVREAMQNPIGTKSLRELARGKQKVVIIASDHTRPVPSKIIMPLMLSEIRAGNPQADITILIATGCHRGTTREELAAKFGDEIIEREKIVVHDCADESMMREIAVLPSGGKLIVNKMALEADLLVAEGFIEPHFFAGFSGGRKSVLPGIASRQTVHANHCSAFIADPHARTGILEGNPIHRDMIFAAKEAKLAFIVNVVINSKQQVIGAFAGDCDKAHLAGANFVGDLCRAPACPADIVITTNNGYPLDQNAYQAVKGMTAAEATCNQGGVIIMVAKCEDGIGGDSFYKTFAENPSAEKLMEQFLAIPQDETIVDQWQSQIFARVLMKCKVVFVSSLDPQTVRGLHMTPAASIEEALQKADQLLGRSGAKITVIPEGISNIIRE